MSTDNLSGSGQLTARAAVFAVSSAPGFDFDQAAAQLCSCLGQEVSFARCSYQGHRALFARVAPAAYHYPALHALALAEGCGFDIIYQEIPVSLHRPGMVMMDMDMTAVQIEGIDELARELGVYEEVSRLTEQAMQGHMDFAQSLRRRVAALAGGDADVIQAVRERMPETPGLPELMELLHRHGFQVGIASGGFTQLISRLDERYGLDFIRANTLEVADGRLTGRLCGDIVDAAAKAAGFAEMQRQFGLPREQTVCLGDGANDLQMLELAGLGVAYHGKPAVVAAARFCLRCSSLHALSLYLQCVADSSCS